MVISPMSTGLSDYEKRQRLLTGSLGARGPPGFEDRIVVRIGMALKMLGNPGRARLYEWIKDGTLDSFLIGRSRFITTHSIKRLIARHLAQARDECGRVKLYDPMPVAPRATNASGAKAHRERRQCTQRRQRRPRAEGSASS